MRVNNEGEKKKKRKRGKGERICGIIVTRSSMNIYESPFVLSSRKSAVSDEACWRRAPCRPANRAAYRCLFLALSDRDD